MALIFPTTYTADPTRYDEKDMTYARCGNSGIVMPRLSLGFWHNFGDFDSFATGLEMVTYAFDHGITCFDLANNYGPPFGSAEENFGRMMKTHFQSYRHEMFITTKAGHNMWHGPYGDGSSRKMLMTSIDESLKRMNLEYVDLFYSHRYDGITPLDETMQALVDIVRSGKALYVGLSKYPIDKLQYCMQYLKDAKVPCLAYQDKYNLLYRNVEAQHLDETKQQGVGFVAFSPLSQGLLTDRYINGIPADSRAARTEGALTTDAVTPELISKLRQLQEIAEKRNQTLAELSLAWLLHDERVTSVIIGPHKLSQLQDNIKAVNNISFTADELQKIDSIFNEK